MPSTNQTNSSNSSIHSNNNNSSTIASSAVSTLHGITRKLGRSFENVRLMASEKIGQLAGQYSGTDPTEYPLTYKQLDEKVESIKEIYDALYKINRVTLHTDDHESVIEGTFKEAVTKIGDSLSRLTSSPQSPSAPPSPSSHAGPSNTKKNNPLIQHVTAGLAAEGASILTATSRTTSPSIGSGGNFSGAAGQLLHAYSQMQLQMGDARLRFNETVKVRFMEPFSAYKVAYETVQRRKRAAMRAKLELDHHRRTGTPSEESGLADYQRNYEKLEQAFLSACDAAIDEMSTFIQYAESTRSLQALINAQQEYYQTCSDIIKRNQATLQ